MHIGITAAGKSGTPGMSTAVTGDITGNGAGGAVWIFTVYLKIIFQSLLDGFDFGFAPVVAALYLGGLPGINAGGHKDTDDGYYNE